MKVPYNGKVNIRLILKRYKNKIFYYVSDFDKPNYSFKPCMLSESSLIDFPFVRFFNDKMKLDTSYSQGASWKRLFDSFEEAEQEAKRINSLYFEGFKSKPYLKIEILEEHKIDLLKIEKDINKLLQGFEDFEGVSFCDVSAGGIQIMSKYGIQPTIKYDFSNKEDIVMEFVSMWYKHENQ